MKYLYFLFICSLLIIFNACSSTVRYASKESEESSSESYNDETAKLLKDENINAENFHSLETEIGIASYYGKEFHGRKTASGEIYNMNGFSAAHVKYPLETIIKVTNLSNSRSIILRINDRMPANSSGRILDLSLGAASELGIINTGTAKVRIDVIKWGN